MEDKSHNLIESSTYALNIEYELTLTWNFKTNTWTHLRHSNLRRFSKVLTIENGWVKGFEFYFDFTMINGSTSKGLCQLFLFLDPIGLGSWYLDLK